MPSELTGRALDAWLAEHAMGWVYKPIADSGKKTPFPWSHPSEPNRVFPLGALPHYSTDWRAAGELVEAMRKREWVLDLYSPRTGADAWEAAFQNRRCGESAEADTPCLAIALAAHAALGGE